MLLPRVTSHPAVIEADAVFSIVIPTWNNLAYLKTCINSIRRNSAYAHQVILHINEGSDGTLEWAHQEGLNYTHSAVNAGICLAVNAAAALAKTEYIVYLNDDMYVCPGWDKHLLDEIKQVGHHYFFLSATMIEPVTGRNAAVMGGYDFGDLERGFDEQRLLQEYAAIPFKDWSGASWPPNVVHYSLWQAVGGYSLEFSPGMYSDPDFSMKLWKAGVRYFKGIERSRVYHFRSRSIHRIRKNNGRKQFYLKWGVPASYLYKTLLHMGRPWNGPLPDEAENGALKKARFKARIQRFF